MHLDDTPACDQKCSNLFMFLGFSSCNNDTDCNPTERCWWKNCLRKFFMY